ncbi:DUF6497 family protein [Roseobacter sp. GAI101]|uniref:DUF6497 family protein n=1 Tax=Roseobacter sp. (strain GAI101) TaxID=391589 RepID=UPI00018726BA|nr:DUF6497 family protein [Roseobacter sp. GAI101]EEB83877.1 conserved hypothetical protein [Roseobacter sp. GAI101]
MKLAAALVLAATPALAIDVPSGQPVDLQEVLVDEIGAETWLRFRFTAPQIARDGGHIGHAQAGPDMAFLCDTLVIPYMAQYALAGDMIVISLADRVTEFGAVDPDATQFFEAFRVNGDTCIWEAL